MRVTVVGGRGFIGSAVLHRAAQAGIAVASLRHDEIHSGADLGTVIYCSGLAWASGDRPLEAYDVHAAAVLKLARTCRWDRIVFVSSTRVYDRGSSTSEDSSIATVPQNVADVYPSSKLAGEGIVLAASPQNRVVRLSNVYGASLRSELFLSDILRQAVATGRISLRSSLASSKDYVSVNDVATLLLRVANSSQERIYNVASGRNTSHGALIDAIRSSIPVDVDIPDEAPTTLAPAIDILRVVTEFDFRPGDVLAEMPDLVRAFERGRDGGEATTRR